MQKQRNNYDERKLKRKKLRIKEERIMRNDSEMITHNEGRNK